MAYRARHPEDRQRIDSAPTPDGPRARARLPTRRYKPRTSLLKEHPQYLQRKRGVFVRVNFFLPAELMVGLRWLSSNTDENLSEHLRKALHRYLVWREAI